LIPPFIGFFSKLFVLFSAITGSVLEIFLALTAIIVSVISAYYYLRIIKVLYVEPVEPVEPEKSKESSQFIESNDTKITGVKILTNIHSLVIAVISLFLVLFFLNPILILTSTRVLSLSLFNF
jgi:NADH:ubiquinone oxidoreductase subunit 2 (subunit N)